jgi:hypothetical protein
MKGIWKAALATSVLAVAAVLLWLLSPLLSDKATDSAMRPAQQSPSKDHSGVETNPPTSVLVLEMTANVHVGNDGLVFELSAKAMTGRATVDFTDRSRLLDPVSTKSTIAFDLRACGGRDRPLGTVRVEVQTGDRTASRTTTFTLSEVAPSTGADALRSLWSPMKIAATWETGNVAVQPDCVVLVARIDTPRSFETVSSR